MLVKSSKMVGDWKNVIQSPSLLAIFSNFVGFTDVEVF
jgi:hypothetical protein